MMNTIATGDTSNGLVMGDNSKNTHGIAVVKRANKLAVGDDLETTNRLVERDSYVTANGIAVEDNLERKNGLTIVKMKKNA